MRSDYRCHRKDIADGITPAYFELIRAANNEPSSIVSHCMIRCSEGKLEGVCAGLQKSVERAAVGES